ncbi:hypothetical protein [Dyadobacter sp. CY347]|uniref:hypothetical protein n=1 Tax=Dyadobacter sp. CY347 TaxID=2909336 RepID=UPI001F413804|nr:hypothetical protein [Dyadobacter sp. CY347]MCF2487473.1 hypothetical protein [Dyadobacter sp. CY347]
MRYFLLMLFSLLQLTAISQSKVTGTFQVDLSGYYTKTQVDSIIKLSGGVITKPPVTLKPCRVSPVITRLISFSNQGAQLQFHGEGVESIQYEVWPVLSGTPVLVDSVSPKSNIIDLDFKKSVLPNGTYTLIIKGKSCLSDKPSEIQFQIKSDQGGTTTPPVIDKPDQPVPVNGTLNRLKTMTEGMDEHMKLAVRDSADVRIFTDLAPDRISPTHSYRYLVNGEIITQKNRLTNYMVSGNNPIRVVKVKLKDGIPSINQWGTQESDYQGGGYYQRDAGELFSYNTSFAFNTFVAPGQSDSKGFLNPILWNYNPDGRQISWPEIAPDMKLPAGKLWIDNWDGYTPELILSKGVTHLPHHWLPWNEADGNRQANALKQAGKTYNNVPRNEVIFKLSKLPPVVRSDGTVITDDYTGDGGTNKFWWPNGGFDKETAIRKADEADISDAIWIGETMENESWTPDYWDMHRHFYKRLRERYEDRFGKRGIPYEIVHNYYYLWPEPISLSRKRPASYFRDLLKRNPENLPSTPYSPGGTLASTTMVTEGIYLGAPDIQIGLIYETIFRFHINKILGLRSGVFLTGKHEYRPNNKYKYVYPEGEFYTDAKVPLDPNVHIAAGFIGQVYGNLVHEWGAPGKKSHKKFSHEWAKGLWFPNGSPFPQDEFPYYSYTNDYYAGFDGGADLTYFSQKLYNETFGQTDRGQTEYLSYKIDGTNWILPDQAYGQEIVSAYDQKRGFVYSQRKDGKIAWFYLNSYADNNWHKLEVRFPNGQTKTFKVSGNAIHARLDIE